MANVSFYGPGTGQALGGSPIQRDYMTDPRRQMAMQLMQQGSSTAPVQSPLEGIARALTAGVGGYFGGQARREMQGREQQLGTDMASVLAGGQAKPWADPDTGVQSTAPAGGYEGMMAAGSRIDNPDMAPFMQNVQMQQMAQQQAQEAEQRKFEQQKEMATFKAGLPNQGTTPSNIAEWNAYQQMTPDEKEQYLVMKRSNPYLNLGGQFVQPSPTQPGVGMGGFEVTPKPEQMPGFRAEVAGAEAQAKAGVDLETAGLKNQKAFDAFDIGMKSVEDTFANLGTDPVTGRFPALTAKAQMAEGAVSTMAPILKSLFREAGEGVFTDKDQELLLDMAPKRTDHPEVVQYKTNMVRQIVAAKLGLGQSQGGASGGNMTVTPETNTIGQGMVGQPSQDDIQAELKRRGLR